MCDEEANVEQNENDQSDREEEEEEEFISLLDLPIEIFLHICSFLDAETLMHNLSLVCKQFYEVLNDDFFWKMRINQIFQNTGYPLLPPG